MQMIWVNLNSPKNYNPDKTSPANFSNTQNWLQTERRNYPFDLNTCSKCWVGGYTTDAEDGICACFPDPSFFSCARLIDAPPLGSEYAPGDIVQMASAPGPSILDMSLGNSDHTANSSSSFLCFSSSCLCCWSFANCCCCCWKEMEKLHVRELFSNWQLWP